MDTCIDFFLRGRGFLFELSIEYVGQNGLSVQVVGHLTKRNGIADGGRSFFLKYLTPFQNLILKLFWKIKKLVLLRNKSQHQS